MNQHPRHMKISELSAYSKTPATTIRYYVREGLLPQPLKTAKTMAYYTEEHLDKLFKIQKLKEEGEDSLAIIKKKLTKNGDKPSALQQDTGELLTSSRDEIIRIGTELFRKKGYDAVKIADIVSSSGIGKGTFYQYFRNKEELFFECLENIFYDIGKDIPEIQTQKDPLKRLQARGLHFFPNYVHMIDMLAIASRASLAHNTPYQEKLSKVLHNFIEPIRKDIAIIIEQRKSPLKNSTLVAYLFMGAVEYSYYCYLNQKKNYDEVYNEFWEFFFGSAPS